ncbi:hypothetical protein MML48_9g00011246 [Holotrichia oblita]|uniref:Uncharacterized protein n=1 Tax=Holotrichia oblita TaxID=644536 RepID=A0ACB9SGQ6_HOLOL|nr:hypothetical protein MML48_9g00011246 [Holotrichia oblita]
MNFKIREDHLLTLADFMESHPEFATGRLFSANPREKFKKLWGDLTMQLNSLGFGERPTEKWQKTWTDYKSNLKKRASEIKRAQSMAGGGPECEKKLLDIKTRILNIFGETFVKGCGVEEKWVSVMVVIKIYFH